MTGIDEDKAKDIENLKYEISQEMGLPQKKKKNKEKA